MTESEDKAITAIGGPQKFFVTADGAYQGSVSSPPDNYDFYDVPPDWIEVPYGPDHGDQIWLFPGWAPSVYLMTTVENAWREAELVVVANQLYAIEEAEAAAEEGEEPPEDLLPGTRNQWLSFRTKVRAWKTGALHFPDMSYRPSRPS